MSRKRIHLFIAGLAAAVLAFGFAACAPKPEPADLILINGKIVTVDPAQPEAEALAARGGVVAAVGTTKEILRYAGPDTKTLDLEGRLAIPGFIDSHAHFTSIGQSKLSLDLTVAESWEDITAMVAEAVKTAKPGDWIMGRGWHQEKWDRVPEPNVDGMPYHTELSRVSPDNPVMLTHASGHSCLANAKAMELSGITARTPDPPGGEITRDAKGVAIGAFLETAQGLLRGAYYTSIDGRSVDEKEAERHRIVELAAQECLSKGITSLHDAGASFSTIDLFKEFADKGRLGVRLYVMVNERNPRLKEKLAAYRMIGYGDNHLTVRSIKRLIDGALGPHGAWLLEPYDSLPTSVGLNTEPVDALTATAAIALAEGFQLCVHAIGDRANRETLDIYEAAFRGVPETGDLRWRIEHAQHLHPDDIPRFDAMGVIPAMQGIHCTSDAPWVFRRLGSKRAEEGAYVWRKLMDTGAVISNGTDAPVENVDPIPSFYATVTRKMKDGQAFFPDQKMTREEALRSYTLNGAYAAFEEDIKGSLVPGKLADITVLSKDIMTVPEDEILNAEVLYTIVGGKILYKKN
ncbi:MAG: amidohydrolase [Acidobacteriota bacterium]|nr:amidohydrolase [Acidobacteriota bacterium]